MSDGSSSDFESSYDLEQETNLMEQLALAMIGVSEHDTVSNVKCTHSVEEIKIPKDFAEKIGKSISFVPKSGDFDKDREVIS